VRDVSRAIDRCSLARRRRPAANVVLGTLDGGNHLHRPPLGETAMTHNARRQRAPNSQWLFASVPKVPWVLIVKSGGFSGRIS
jgi:hypothetical protein